MAVQGFVCLFILYLLESDSFQRAVRALCERSGDDRQQADVELMTAGGGVPMQAPVEDNDVAAERQRIVNTSGG